MKWGDREPKVHIPMVYEEMVEAKLKEVPRIEEVRRRWRKLLEQVRKDRRKP